MDTTQTQTSPIARMIKEQYVSQLHADIARLQAHLVQAEAELDAMDAEDEATGCPVCGSNRKDLTGEARYGVVVCADCGEEL